MHLRAFMTLIAVAVLATGCVPAAQTCLDADAYGLDSSVVLDSTLPDPSFLLGVEYIQNGLEDTYAATGVASAKTRLEAFVHQARAFQKRRARRTPKAAPRDAFAPTRVS